MALKICGLREGDDVSFTDSPLVTHVGFVFVPASKRYIEPKQAGQLVQAISGRSHTIGVFVDTSYESVKAALEQSGVTGAQLHGGETPEFCQRLREDGYTVWKALTAPRDHHQVEDVARLIASFVGSVDAILLDATPPKGVSSQVTGGHGVSFDWSVLPTLDAWLAREQVDIPIWVAGGLNRDNVPNLYETYLPAGIDLSSGVEVEGRKSLNKIREIVEVVNRHGRTSNVS